MSYSSNLLLGAIVRPGKTIFGLFVPLAKEA